MVEHVLEGSIGILLIIVLENGYLWLFCGENRSNL